MAPSLVTIATFRDLFDAQLAKIRLEIAGIEWFFADEATVHANWFYSNAVGDIKLQVRKSDLQRAMEILRRDRIPEDFGVEVIQEEPRISYCPRCHSARISYYPRAEPAVFLFLLIAILPCLLSISYIFLFLGILPLLLPEGKWGCEDCAYQWRGKAEYP
ncbi:MAG: hypothetical protein ABIH23_06785 [bacterium]